MRSLLSLLERARSQPCQCGSEQVWPSAFGRSPSLLPSLKVALTSTPTEITARLHPTASSLHFQ